MALPHPARRIVALAAAALLALAGCGEDDEDDSSGPPDTELAAALASVGDGVSPTGSGFGWVDLDGLRGYQGDNDWGPDALGPGADDLFDDSEALFDATGFDPGYASEGLAISGSYALGVRLDGEEGSLFDTQGLARALRAAGARVREEPGWTLYNLGRPAEGPTGGPLLPLGALASRIAIASDGNTIVLARADNARAALIAERGELFGEDSEKIEAATHCLGEVVAARLIPRSFTHNQSASPDLIAFGARPLNEGVPPREILCAIEEDPSEADEHEAALEAAFAEDALDPVTGRPVSDTVANAEISRESEDGLEVVRAELEPANGAAAGHLFGAFLRGTLLSYLGAEPPAQFRPKPQPAG